MDNHDLLQWRVRGMDGVEANVPSVVFRIPPPDPRLANMLSRLHGQFEKLRKTWDRKHHLVSRGTKMTEYTNSFESKNYFLGYTT